MAVKGPVADVFIDSEFLAPGSVPLWGAGGLEEDNTDCTGFLCMLRRPFYWLVNRRGVHSFSNAQLGLNERDESMPGRPLHWFVNEHGVHTFSNDQLGLKERDESTHYPVFMHLWATNILGGTGAALRSDAAQSRRLLKAATKNDRKRQRRLNQAAASIVDPATSTATAGGSQSAPSTRPVYSKEVFQLGVAQRGSGARLLQKVW